MDAPTHYAPIVAQFTSNAGSVQHCRCLNKSNTGAKCSNATKKAIPKEEKNNSGSRVIQRKKPPIPGRPLLKKNKSGAYLGGWGTTVLFFSERTKVEKEKGHSAGALLCLLFFSLSCPSYFTRAWRSQVLVLLVSAQRATAGRHRTSCGCLLGPWGQS